MVQTAAAALDGEIEKVTVCVIAEHVVATVVRDVPHRASAVSRLLAAVHNIRLLRRIRQQDTSPVTGSDAAWRDIEQKAWVFRVGSDYHRIVGTAETERARVHQICISSGIDAGRKSIQLQ